MKVKNVLIGLLKKYDLQEINILSTDSVVFSGSLEDWKTTSVDMIFYKRSIENSEVLKRFIFNNRKVFIFIK